MKIDYSFIEYRTLLLGAFLHDIGKLLNRYSAPGIKTKEHPFHSAEFIAHHRTSFEVFSNVNTLAELVQKHHEK
jgi:predicted HD phosphohydrolase